MVAGITPGVCGESVGVFVVCWGVSGGRGVGKGCCLRTTKDVGAGSSARSGCNQSIPARWRNFNLPHVRLYVILLLFHWMPIFLVRSRLYRNDDVQGSVAKYH